MNIEFTWNGRHLEFDPKVSAKDVIQKLGTPVSDDSDHAEQYLTFEGNGTALRLTWSKRHFLWKPFERLEEVQIEVENGDSEQPAGAVTQESAQSAAP